MGMETTSNLTTIQEARTYGEAAKVAESVNTEQLIDFIAEDDNVDVFTQARCRGCRIALGDWDFQRYESGYVYATFATPDPEGYTTFKAIDVSTRPIIRNWKTGRVVRWEAK